MSTTCSLLEVTLLLSINSSTLLYPKLSPDSTVLQLDICYLLCKYKCTNLKNPAGESARDMPLSPLCRKYVLRLTFDRFMGSHLPPTPSVYGQNPSKCMTSFLRNDYFFRFFGYWGPQTLVQSQENFCKGRRHMNCALWGRGSISLFSKQ